MYLQGIILRYIREDIKTHYPQAHVITSITKYLFHTDFIYLKEHIQVNYSRFRYIYEILNETLIKLVLRFPVTIYFIFSWISATCNIQTARIGNSEIYNNIIMHNFTRYVNIDVDIDTVY